MAETEQCAVVKREHQVRADNIKRPVAAIEVFLEAFDARQHAVQVPIRLQKLDQFYEQYVEEVVQLQMLPVSNPPIDYVKALDRFEGRYYSLKGRLTQLLPENSTVAVPTGAPSPVKHIKFPELKLPEFSGNPLEWQSFHDRFSSAVPSSTDLSGSEKFQYLNGLLRGEAAGLVSEIPISDANYAEAWKRLMARYDDKRVLVKCHLAELFETPAMKQESTEGLLNLVDCFDRNISILKKLGEPVEAWSTLLVYQLSQRLDQNTLREWENHFARNTTREEGQDIAMPKYRDMVSFLQGHARVLQALAPVPRRSRESKGKPPIKFSTLHVAQPPTSELTVSRKCLQCEGDHFLYQCSKFRKLSPRQRFDFVKQ